MAQSFTFDGPNKIIQLASTSSFLVEDMYSRWKEWVLDSDNAKYLQAFRFVGGDPTVAGAALGSTYFILNGWRIQPTSSDHVLDVEGNLYENDGGDPFTYASGSYKVLVRLNVSNLVDARFVASEFEQALDYDGKVYIHTTAGASGSVYPLGTIGSPVSNIPQALTIADTYGFVDLVLLNDQGIVGQDLSGRSIHGVNRYIDLYISGCNVRNTEFVSLTISGSMADYNVDIIDSTLVNISHFNGSAKECALSGSLSIDGSSQVTLAYCYSTVPGTGSPVINLENSSGAGLSIRSYSGGIRFVSCSDPSFLSTVEFTAGRMNLGSDNTAGFISVRGVAGLYNTSTMTVDTGSLINSQLMDSAAMAILSMDTKVDEIHKVHGLDSANDVVVTKTGRTVGSIDQDFVETGTPEDPIVTITRNP